MIQRGNIRNGFQDLERERAILATPSHFEKTDAGLIKYTPEVLRNNIRISADPSVSNRDINGLLLEVNRTHYFPNPNISDNFVNFICDPAMDGEIPLV